MKAFRSEGAIHFKKTDWWLLGLGGGLLVLLGFLVVGLAGHGVENVLTG
jgi:hypothetical protein